MPLTEKSRRRASSCGRRENDLIGASAIAVTTVGAERGDLDLERARPQYLDDPEARPDGKGAAEQLLHRFRPSIGGDVVILGNQAEHFIVHAAARPERLMAGVLHLLNDGNGERTLGHRS